VDHLEHSGLTSIVASPSRPFVTLRRGERFTSLKAANASRSFGVGSYDSSWLAGACVAGCLLFFGDFNVLPFPFDKAGAKSDPSIDLLDMLQIEQDDRPIAGGSPRSRW
jgi:hypothetical protein